MKSLLNSTFRVVAALLVVAVVVSLGGGGWMAWQDRSYAAELSRAHDRVDQRNEDEIQAAIRTVPTYLCEKRRGMPVTEVLTRIVHVTDKEGIAAARRTELSLQKVDAPGRWADFQQLVLLRRMLLVDLAVAYDAANARAIEVASSALPRTNLGVVEALAADRQYRTLDSTARGLLQQTREIEVKLRKAAPSHRLPSDAIKRELQRTTHWGTLDLGAMYETATMPRAPQTEGPTGGATTSSGDATSVSAGTSPTPAVPVPGSTEPRC